MNCIWCGQFLIDNSWGAFCGKTCAQEALNEEAYNKGIPNEEGGKDHD